MEAIYNWSAKRAGGRITVTGTTGDSPSSPPRKVPNVDVITVTDETGSVVATDKNGQRYWLRERNALRSPTASEV